MKASSGIEGANILLFSCMIYPQRRYHDNQNCDQHRKSGHVKAQNSMVCRHISTDDYGCLRRRGRAHRKMYEQKKIRYLSKRNDARTKIIVNMVRQILRWRSFCLA